jgi:hypothetical protein
MPRFAREEGLIYCEGIFYNDCFAPARNDDEEVHPCHCEEWSDEAIFDVPLWISNTTFTFDQ